MYHSCGLLRKFRDNNSKRVIDNKWSSPPFFNYTNRSLRARESIKIHAHTVTLGINLSDLSKWLVRTDTSASIRVCWLITTFDTNDFKLPWLSGYFILYLWSSINLKSLEEKEPEYADDHESEMSVERIPVATRLIN